MDELQIDKFVNSVNDFVLHFLVNQETIRICSLQAELSHFLEYSVQRRFLVAIDVSLELLSFRWLIVTSCNIDVLGADTLTTTGARASLSRHGNCATKDGEKITRNSTAREDQAVKACIGQEIEAV
jgi:hypothetical protein